MAGTSQYIFVNYPGEEDYEIMLPTVEQHVIDDFFRRQREAEIDQQELATIAELDTSSKDLESAQLPRCKSTSLLTPPYDDRPVFGMPLKPQSNDLATVDPSVLGTHSNMNAGTETRQAAVRCLSNHDQADHAIGQIHSETTVTPLYVSHYNPMKHLLASTTARPAQSHEPDLTKNGPHKQIAQDSTDPNFAFRHTVWHGCQNSNTRDASNMPLVSTGSACRTHRSHCSSDYIMTPDTPPPTVDIIARGTGSTDEASQEHERSISPSDSDQSWFLSDTASRVSSGRLMDDLDDLDNHILDMEASRFRSWLLVRSRSEPFLRHLQCQVTHRQHNSSTPQDQSTGSSSKSTSNSSSPPASSSGPTTLSGSTLSGSKRRRDDPGENDERSKKKRHVPSDKGEATPAPRLACFYNRYDPMMYRSCAQTDKRFEVCETHDFGNMNRLYEHLKRVHSHQPLQCPRCTQTGFRNTEELQAHQTASEPCLLVSLTAVKRIKWISHDERLALQVAVNRQSAELRRLGTCAEEDKWKIAYGWLFPNAENIPSPYFQDPVISTVSFVIDDYERRLQDLIRQSCDLEDLTARIPTIHRQFLAQYNIHNHEPGQDPPSFSSAVTLPGVTCPQRPTASSDLVEARQYSRFQDDSNQFVSPRVCRISGRGSSPGHSSALLSPQATPPRPELHSTTSSRQPTGTCYSHTDDLHPQTSANTGSLMPPIQWQDQLPSRAPNIPNTAQWQYSPIQTITEQFQDCWSEDGELAWVLDQDTTESPGTIHDTSHDFMTLEFFDAESFDDPLKGHGRDGLPATQMSTSAGL